MEEIRNRTLPDWPPIPPNPIIPDGIDVGDWGTCLLINNHAQMAILNITAIISSLFYLMCFILGCHNIWFILIKKRYYRSAFLTLQYFFGQSICVLKFTTMTYMYFVAHTIKESDICADQLYSNIFNLEKTIKTAISYTEVALFSGLSVVLAKLCLGAATLAVISSVYFKIKILFYQEHIKLWDNRYRYWVYGGLTLIIAIYVSILPIVIAHFRRTVNAQLTTFVTKMIRGEQDEWFTKTYRTVGCTLGTCYITLAIAFIVLLYGYLFPLLQNPNFIEFDDIKDQTKPLRKITVIFICTFIFIAILFGLLGTYQNIFGPTDFALFEMYFVISLVSEVPNMFYLYYQHFKSLGSNNDNNLEDIKVSFYNKSIVGNDSSINVDLQDNPFDEGDSISISLEQSNDKIRGSQARSSHTRGSQMRGLGPSDARRSGAIL